jgi:hypothetical protein
MPATTNAVNVANKIFLITVLVCDILFMRILFLLMKQFQLMQHIVFLRIVNILIYLNCISIILLLYLIFYDKPNIYIVRFLLVGEVFSLLLALYVTQYYYTATALCFFEMGTGLLALCCTKSDKCNRVKRFLMGVLIIFILAAYIPILFKNERVWGVRYFDSAFLQARDKLLFYCNEKTVNEKYIIVDKEKFISDLDKVIDPTQRRIQGRDYLMSLRGYFKADVFNLLILRNVFFLRVDIAKASHYVADIINHDTNAQNIKGEIVRRIAFQAKEYWTSYDEYFIKGGSVVGRYLGSPDLKSPVLFGEGAENLYVALFVFKNKQPFSIIFNNSTFAGDI